MASVLSDFMRLQMDMLRTPQDFMAGVLGRSWMEKLAPVAKTERPVITLPGFAAPASSHARLVGFLNSCGYAAQTFEAGFPADETIPDFVRKLDASLGVLIKELAERYGTRVSLVGQSAGGMFSREFAAFYPGHIDRVITLGAPTADPTMGHLHNRALEVLVKRISGAAGFEEQSGPKGILHWAHNKPTLPYVAICSPVDGAVSEATALVPAETVSRSSKRAPRENIRIRCSHFGMAYNPFVFLAVADRLGQNRSMWQDFDPAAYFPRCPRRLLHRVFPVTGSLDSLSIPRHTVAGSPGAG
jgi:pimeloyl-ACP methyl ester carboxylesterase